MAQKCYNVTKEKGKFNMEHCQNNVQCKRMPINIFWVDMLWISTNIWMLCCLGGIWIFQTLDINKHLDVLLPGWWWIYFVVFGYSRPLCQLYGTDCQSRLSIFGEVWRITGIHGASWDLHLPETKIILSRTNTFHHLEKYYDFENTIDNFDKYVIT